MFNQNHSVKAVLERHGYTRTGERFIRPGGKSASVSVKDGRSCHLSSNDPLNDGKVRSGIGIHDSFDVFTILEHGGDAKAAVKAAARLLGIEASPHAINTRSDTSSATPRPNEIVESIEPMRLAELYIKARHLLDGQSTLRRYREQWWVFEQGGYRVVPNEIATVDIYQFLDRLWTPVYDPRSGGPTGEYERLKVRSHFVKEVAQAIPACGIMIDGEIPQWLDGRWSPKPANVIAFQNGLLDAEAWCRGVIELLPLTPLWFSGRACPYHFDPNATCLNWLKFLNEIFNQDKQCIALLQEWFGLNLIPDNQYEKFMMFVGPPRSGKGTALEVLGAVLGEAQTVMTSFTKLASRFGLAPMVGKLAAILPDAHISSHTDARAALEVLKSVTGNDPQPIDRNGIDELPRVQLYNRFSIAVNELPKLPDEAGALKTRLLLLHFPNSYAGREDVTLKPRINAEAPGVALWGLRGLSRLRSQGKFTIPERSTAMIKVFEKLMSPVLSFLDDCCESIPGDESIWVEKDLLFAAWCEWSRDRGSDAGCKADFGQSLLNVNKGIDVAKRGPRGAQFRVYTGVRLCS
jgi:P4 family phage/plasmid primase-like protien